MSLNPQDIHIKYSKIKTYFFSQSNFIFLPLSVLISKVTLSLLYFHRFVKDDAVVFHNNQFMSSIIMELSVCRGPTELNGADRRDEQTCCEGEGGDSWGKRRGQLSIPRPHFVVTQRRIFSDATATCLLLRQLQFYLSALF